MIRLLVHHSFFLVLIATISATATDEKSGSALENIINFIIPTLYESVVVVANNSLENRTQRSFDAETAKEDFYNHKYYVTEESVEGEPADGKFLWMKKEKKPCFGKFEDSEPKPYNNAGILITNQPPIINRKPEAYESSPISEEIKVIKLPKLSDFLPKRKTILLTSTVVVHETFTNKIYPSCLKIRNAQSICTGNLITVTPYDDKLVSNTQPTESDDGVEMDVREEQDVLINNAKPSIRPTTTIPIKMTKAAALQDTADQNSDIEESEEILEQLSSPRIVTPGLNSATNSENNASELKFLSNFLKPKVEYLTEFLYVTKTLDIYDYSHTATVVALNCLPAQLKLPPCPPEKPVVVIHQPEKYHSEFIELIKAQDNVRPNLSEDDRHHLSSLASQMVPPYREITRPKPNYPVMDEQVLKDGLTRIQGMIDEYVAHRVL